MMSGEHILTKTSFVTAISRSDSQDAFLGVETPRQMRVIQALLRHPCTRAQIDDVGGASNGPELIAQLRRRGLTIQCELVVGIDRDGLQVKHGVYRLTDKDRKKLNAWQKKNSKRGARR